MLASLGCQLGVGFITNVETNLTAFRFRLGWWRLHELFDFVKDVDNGLLVNVHPSCQSPF